jgi:hypothetical protein
MIRDARYSRRKTLDVCLNVEAPDCDVDGLGARIILEAVDITVEGFIIERYIRPIFFLLPMVPSGD